MRLVSMLTENYVPRAEPFLRSLSLLVGANPCVIGLGFSFGGAQDFEREFGLYQGFPGWEFICMPRHWSESSLGICQHGRWLDALPDVRDDEVYLLTDADIVIQRDFTPEERRRFESCGENIFLAGWNAKVGDTLHEEAKRIGMTPDDSFPCVEPGSMCEPGDWDIPCYNTGVLAMRGRNWKRLRDLYESRCERFYKLTSHRSRGQWLLNFCLHRLGLQAEILPLSVHAHAHFGIPARVAIRDGAAYHDDKLILFRHAF